MYVKHDQQRLLHVSMCKLENWGCACAKKIKMLLVYAEDILKKTGTQSDVLMLKIPSQHALLPQFYFNWTFEPSRIECHL